MRNILLGFTEATSNDSLLPAAFCQSAASGDWAGRTAIAKHAVERCNKVLKRPIETKDMIVHFFGIVEKMANQTRIGEFELLVMLTVIRLDGEAYGVPISREIERQTGREITFPTVYSTLERLQKKGLVRSDLGDSTPERGGRAKRYFHVTAKGLRTVRETKQCLIRMWQGLPELEGGIA